MNNKFYFHAVGDVSEAERDFQKLIDTVLQAKGAALSPVSNFPYIKSSWIMTLARNLWLNCSLFLGNVSK